MPFVLLFHQLLSKDIALFQKNQNQIPSHSNLKEHMPFLFFLKIGLIASFPLIMSKMVVHKIKRNYQGIFRLFGDQMNGLIIKIYVFKFKIHDIAGTQPAFQCKQISRTVSKIRRQFPVFPAKDFRLLVFCLLKHAWWMSSFMKCLLSRNLKNCPIYYFYIFILAQYLYYLTCICLYLII